MRKVKLRSALWLVLIALALMLGFYLWGSPGTPLGQPPLALLSANNLNQQLISDFDRASGDSRLVLLLSPT